MGARNPYDERTRRRMQRGVRSALRETDGSGVAARHRFLVVRLEGGGLPEDRKAPTTVDDLDTRGLELAFLVDNEYVDDATWAWLGDVVYWSAAARTDWLTSVGLDDDPARLHLVGLCSALARDGTRAVEAFERARRAAPESEAAALNAALAHIMLSNSALARSRLQDIVDAGGACVATTRARAALQQLDDVEAADARQVHLARLHRDRAREAVARGEAIPDDRVLLVRAMLSLHAYGELARPPWQEMLEVLLPLDDSRIDVLECRVMAHRMLGDTAAEDRVTRVLRRRSPESPMLDPGTTREELLARGTEGLDRMHATAETLWKSAISGSGPSADAALDVLQDLVAGHPENEFLLGIVALSHISRGEDELARRAAHELAARPHATHERHFTLAQVYARLDPGLRDQHLDAAETLATNDDDRADVTALRAYMLGDRDAVDRRFG